MQRYFSPYWYYADSMHQMQEDIAREDRKFLPRYLTDAQEFRDDQKNDLEIIKWPQALQGLNRLMEATELGSDQIAILEYRFDTRQRIDAVLCGRNRKGEDTAYLLEIKSWFRPGERFNLRERKGDQRITAVIDGDPKSILHPSVQVKRYRDRIECLLDEHFLDPTNIRLRSAVYFPDMEDMHEDWRKVLFAKKFKPYTDISRMYLQWNEQKLFNSISANIRYGSGVSTLQKLTHISPIKDRGRDEDKYHGCDIIEIPEK